MRRCLPLLLTGMVFIAACSKKSNTYPIVPYKVTPPLPAGTVTTVAGTGSPGAKDGAGATFAGPNGLCVTSNDYLYVADLENNLIREVDQFGGVLTFAGSGTDSLANGTGTVAAFAFPAGVAMDKSGNVYVADFGNAVIRKITSNAVVTTYAGTGVAGSANGAATAATFNGPDGVAVDALGNVYVSDMVDNLIRKIDASGNVTTLAGSGKATFANGTGTAASFNAPNGIAVDASGNVYVADLVNRLIREITPAGVVTTFAGGGVAGIDFVAPAGVAVDANGNVYVADESTNLISMITQQGVSSTIAGSGAAGFTNAVGTKASFNFPTGVAVDPNGNVFVVDRGNNAIRKISSGK